MIQDQALRNQNPGQKETSGHGHHSRLQPNVTRHSTRGATIAPNEVLFRRKDAPERYVEKDVYNAHERDLPQSGLDILPDSDLLTSVHAYSSRFYGAMERRRNQRAQESGGVGSGALGRRSVDEQSMDETALLAFGILLEEAGREILGRRGDLVFTEGIVGADGSSGDEVARHTEPAVGYRDVGTSSLSRGANNGAVAGTRLPKRRRLADLELEGAQD